MSRILIGDCRTTLAGVPAGSVQTCITSPPYFGLRSYAGGEAEIGQEGSVAAYVAALVETFRAVRRVLRPDGTLWLNLGDSYGGARGNLTPAPDNKHRHNEADTPGVSKGDTDRKQLLGIPWRVAFALQDDGWILRRDIIWAKPNAMPESVTDRPTSAHEYIFLFAPQPRYFYDAAAIAEPAAEPERQRWDRIGGANGHTVRHSEGGMMGSSATRNKRSVWTVPTAPYPGAHFATWPEALVRPMVLAGSRVGDTVLDPFAGSGTTLAVAQSLGRAWLGCELNAAYVPLIEQRLVAVTPWWEPAAAPERNGWHDTPLFAGLETA